MEEGAERTPRFQLFLVPALLLLLLDTLLSERTRVAARMPRALAPTPSLPTAAAATLAFVLIPGPGPGASAARAAQRAAAYRHAIEQGDHSGRTLYNYGTALLDADSVEGAIAALSQAVEARDADVRYRAGFKQGLAHLQRGLAAQHDSGASELDAALDAYKRLLLARPGDADARWNYELALRKRQNGGGGGGGSGGGAGNNHGNDRTPPPQAGQQPTGGALGKKQAEELLNNAAREEREVQGKQQRLNQPELPPGGKDW
jgi:Ca-activated chloride channel family protein